MTADISALRIPAPFSGKLSAGFLAAAAVLFYSPWSGVLRSGEHGSDAAAVSCCGIPFPNLKVTSLLEPRPFPHPALSLSAVIIWFSLASGTVCRCFPSFHLD